MLIIALHLIALHFIGFCFDSLRSYEQLARGEEEEEEVEVDWRGLQDIHTWSDATPQFITNKQTEWKHKSVKQNLIKLKSGLPTMIPGGLSKEQEEAYLCKFTHDALL